MRRPVGIVLLLVATGCTAGARAQPALVGVLGITSEIVAIEQRLQDAREVPVRGFVVRRGTLGGRPAVVARTGTGKVNAAIATTVLIEHFSPAAVFSPELPARPTPHSALAMSWSEQRSPITTSGSRRQRASSAEGHGIQFLASSSPCSWRRPMYSWRQPGAPRPS